MQYTVDFLAAFREKLGALSKINFMKDFSIDIDGDMGLPPILDVVRYMTEMGDPGGMSGQSKEAILKYAIIGKPVTIYYKGKSLGMFTMNGMGDRLDDFPPLKKNPIALMLLMELTSSKMVEKSLPPQIESDPPVAAKLNPGSQKQSSGKSEGA